MAEERSRTEYSARNTSVALAARLTAIFMGFLARVVFTHTLSEAYVGVNGLFTDVLRVLALSELGIGTAITYALYGPIAKADIEKQKSLMALYKKFYYIVAGSVLAFGLLVVPFMDVLIKDEPAVDHLYLIYFLYLANSVVSYIGIYRKTLMDAHQLSYIGVLYQTFFWTLQNILQIVLLITTKNLILYLIAMILCTICNNICVTIKANKLYPYLKDKNVAPLPKEEREGIFANIRAMLMHKIGNVMVNNTDNLLLSALVGTLSVGCYSNYFLVVGSVRQLLEQVFQGITASVGNLGVKEKAERIHRIFTATFFLGQWFVGMITIAMFEVLDTFVGISFGEQYVFPRYVTLVLCLNFYFNGMRQPTLVFRDSMGLFRYDRYKSIAEAIINLVVSILLGMKFGTIGVFLGTLVSTLTTSFWVEPYMLYKHRLDRSSREYYLKYIFYTVITFALWYGEDLLCRRITGNPWLVCIARGVLCLVITNLVYLLLYHRKEEFRLLWNKAIELLNKKLHRTEKEISSLPKEEQTLFALLRGHLTGKEAETIDSCPEDIDWEKLDKLATNHAVLPFMADMFAELPMPRYLKLRAEQVAMTAAKQNYRFLMMDKYLTGILSEQGVEVVILKGVSTGSLYPMPELRKTGDVDLLLCDKGQIEKACDVLKAAGFEMTEYQPSLHHVVFESEEGFDIELHSMLAEPFDNNFMNQYMDTCLDACKDNILRKEILGVELPILADAYHAFELLLHMLQHYLRKGFGLKLLCDWVIFWNRDIAEEEKEKYLRLVKESGTKGFSDMVTLACCRYLGLSEQKTEWMELTRGNTELFMREILEAEEFGGSSKDRMVALRGNSLFDYIREFHHQMCLNWPKINKIVILWPVLWVHTLVRFLVNNRSLRKVSTMDIMRKAGQRGELIRKMKLFERK